LGIEHGPLQRGKKKEKAVFLTTALIAGEEENETWLG
jgi:hypothetical protein